MAERHTTMIAVLFFFARIIEISRQKVICLWPQSLQVNSTRRCPDSAETRLGAPHLLHLTSIRVLPCVIGRFRAIASFTKRSDSSRIASFDIAGARGFLT